MVLLCENTEESGIFISDIDFAKIKKLNLLIRCSYNISKCYLYFTKQVDSNVGM